MARRIKRINKNKIEDSDGAQVARGSGLAEAWPSSPTRPPKYVLYCTNHESDRIYVVNACALYAIRKLFDAIVGENEIEPSPTDDNVVSFGEIDIKSDQLKEILDHQYSKAEEAWELVQPYPNDIEQFLHGARMSKELEQRRAPGEAAPERVKREKAPAKTRVDRTGLITVQSLAQEAGIDPRDARAALRKAKVEKPAGGWAGDETWAKSIRDVLAKAAKELKKKGDK